MWIMIDGSGLAKNWEVSLGKFEMAIRHSNKEIYIYIWRDSCCRYKF